MENQRVTDAAAEIAEIVLKHIATGTGPCDAACFEPILTRFEEETLALSRDGERKAMPTNSAINEGNLPARLRRQPANKPRRCAAAPYREDLIPESNAGVREAMREIINRRVCNFADDYDEAREEMIDAIISLLPAAREEAQRRLAMVRGCLDCNADDARFWVAVIDFLKEMERC